LALGRPVVSTSVGCEGLAVRTGEHLLIADTPAEFADCVVRLLTQDENAESMCSSGRRLVEQCYDWSVITRKALEVYRRLGPDEKCRS